MNIVILFIIFILCSPGLFYNKQYKKLLFYYILIHAILFTIVLYLYKKYIYNKYETFLNKQHNKCVLFSHDGVGDMINHIGAVRYLSEHYNSVVVLFNEKADLKNKIPPFYEDKQNIIFNSVPDLDNIIKDYIKNYDEYDKYIGGQYVNVLYNKEHIPYKVPFSFYEDMNIDIPVFWNYAHIPYTKQSTELYNNIANMKYIFMTNNTSHGKLFDVETIESKFNINRNDILIICSDNNIYEPGHKYYEIANKFVQQPLIDYVDTIENASYIVVSDSAFFCVSLQLKIKTDNCYYVARGNADYTYLWEPATGFKKKSGKKIFKQLII